MQLRRKQSSKAPKWATTGFFLSYEGEKKTAASAKNGSFANQTITRPWKNWFLTLYKGKEKIGFETIEFVGSFHSKLRFF